MGIANIHSIPQELVDIIIDYLHNDYDTLCTCALVCKHWIPSSRNHFSAKIMVNYSEGQVPRSYVDFLRLLDAPGCTLVPFLRRLVIEDYREYCFQACDVLHLFHRFSALHSISIQLLRYDVTWHEAPELFSGLIQITDVSIAGTYFVHPDDPFDLVCSFPSLRNLHLSRLGSLDNDRVPSTRIPIPNTLRFLHIKDRHEPVLRWLMSSDKMPALNTIRITDIPWDALPCISNFLGMLGDTLLHLELDFSSSEEMMDGCIGNIDLSPNTNLRSLAIYSSQGDMVKSHLINRGYLAKLLSRLSSPYVEEISIWLLELMDIDEIQPDDWADIDRTLGMPQFSCLKKLLLTLGSVDDLTESVRQRLPGSHKRGILVFKDPLLSLCYPG